MDIGRGIGISRPGELQTALQTYKVNAITLQGDRASAIVRDNTLLHHVFSLST